jgi:hypothetical protein
MCPGVYEHPAKKNCLVCGDPPGYPQDDAAIGQHRLNLDLLFVAHGLKRSCISFRLS